MFMELFLSFLREGMMRKRCACVDVELGSFFSAS